MALVLKEGMLCNVKKENRMYVLFQMMSCQNSGLRSFEIATVGKVIRLDSGLGGVPGDLDGSKLPPCLLEMQGDQPIDVANMVLVASLCRHNPQARRRPENAPVQWQCRTFMQSETSSTT